MGKTPFMPLIVADFIADTVDMDATETGAYLMMLLAQWKRNGASLPDDQAKLQRITRCRRNWPGVWETIRVHFLQDAEGWYNEKGREMFTNARNISTANSNNGALGGRAKALNSQKPPVASATISPQQLELDKKKEREPIGSPKKSAGDAPPPKADPKGSRLPETWFLPMAWGKWAVNRGLSYAETKRQEDLFKNYWLSKAGRDARKIDWNRTWQNWVIKAIDDGEGRHGQRDSTSAPQGGQRSNAAVEQIARLTGLTGTPGYGDAGNGGDGEEDGQVWLGEGQEYPGT